MDGQITITSTDLVDYTILYRKRHETVFRRDYISRHSTHPADDPALAALNSQLGDIETRLKPLEERLRQVDLVMIIPKRADLISLNAEVNQHPREQLDAALKGRSGPIYELLKKRAEITKQNFERREEISRLTILLNMLPRPQAEALRTLVESNAAQDVTISTLTEEQQAEVVTLLGRLGMTAYLAEGLLTLDKKKVEGQPSRSYLPEVAKSTSGGNSNTIYWIPSDKLGEWEENEKHMTELGRKIQTCLAKSQADGLDENGQKEFESFQNLYLELRMRRNLIANVRGPVAVNMPKSERPPVRASVPTIDLGPMSQPES